MNKKFAQGIVLGIIFLVYTVVALKMNEAPIGPEGSVVGLSSINGPVHEFLGYNAFWHKLSDVLGIVAILVCVFFGLVGCYQWFKRKNIFKVDIQIISLGIFYIIVIGLYVLFDKVALNYRPVILDEGLEASYPSSHTMLTITVMISAMMMAKHYLKDLSKLYIVYFVCAFVMALTIISRTVAGIHWISDIIGSLLISASLLHLYAGVLEKIKNVKLVK